jgi:hypothetical protein
MKDINTKAIMVVSIIVLSAIAMPVMATAQPPGGSEIGEREMIGMYRGFTGGFGGLFSALGYGGNLIGKIFEMLLMQGLDYGEHEVLENVFVLSANEDHTFTGIHEFKGRPEIYILPRGYDSSGVNGYAYCVVRQEGSFEYELTTGAGITLVLWDNDRSFINAITRVIDFINELRTYEGREGQIPETVISEGVEVLTWFLIHINDIFTGDELFVLNPITWQSLNLIPDESFSITKKWFETGSDYRMNVGDAPISPSITNDWLSQALEWKDSRMQWLLTKTPDVEIAQTIYTQFSFDLLQLWVKNFEIHIDVSELLNIVSEGENFNMADVFQGCDINFYLFTHHLAGVFLYNDLDQSGDVSVTYEELLDEQGNPVMVNDTVVEVPDSMELTHRVILGTVENFNFVEPTIDTAENKVSWGLTLENADIAPVPVEVDLESYLKTYQDNLDFIHFGFTFEPKISEEIEADDGSTYRVASGSVKLDQMFAPWNDGAGPNSDISGLDLAILYVSQVLHFHLNVETIGVDPEDPTSYLDPEEDYDQASHKLRVGNYLDPNIANHLDFVDIAGPYYEYGYDASSTTQVPASTSIIPLALWQGEREKHETFLGDEEDVTDDFAADITVTADYNVMVYAVCYPEFKGTGVGIWHDPTFSVYMIFTPEGFWAVILLIAGVALVGIATVLIKRRKDRSY